MRLSQLSRVRQWLGEGGRCRPCARYRLGVLAVILLLALTWSLG
jgi:hypothetical protein